MTRTLLSGMLAFALGIGVFFSFSAPHSGMALHAMMDVMDGEQEPLMSELCLLHCLLTADSDASFDLATPIVALVMAFAAAIMVMPRLQEVLADRPRARSPSPLRGRFLLTTCKRE